MSPDSHPASNASPTQSLLAATSASAPLPPAFPPELIKELSDAVVSSQEVRNRLADEVGETIFQSPKYKHHLRSAITTLIATRLAAHAAAVEHFSLLAQEARAPWRTLQGGPNGAPTPTAELLNAMQLTLTEIKHGDDVLLRTVKLAIDEAKSERDHMPAPLDGLNSRYTGKDEGIVIPPDITPVEREQCRVLFNVIVGGLARRRGVQVPSSPGQMAEEGLKTIDGHLVPDGSKVPSTSVPAQVVSPSSEEREVAATSYTPSYTAPTAVLPSYTTSAPVYHPAVSAPQSVYPSSADTEVTAKRAESVYHSPLAEANDL